MLDETKLENLREGATGKRIARCPACAESGRDGRAEHLVIYEGGKFACVVNPGKEGASHRKRIWVLAGVTAPKGCRKAFPKPIPVEIRAA